MNGLLDNGGVWILAIGLIVWLILSLFQLRRGINNRFVRRSCFLLMGIVGLILLILRPSVNISQDLVSAYIMTSNEAMLPPSRFRFNSINEFLNSDISNRTDTLHILGDGLPLEELVLISGYNTKYHQGSPLPGITSYDHKRITEYSSWTLSGSYRGDIKSIAVEDPKSKVTFCNLMDSTFRVDLVGPPAGEYLYPIKVTFSNGDSIVEQIPITSHKSNHYNLLSLSSYPSFELNFLKNYWSSKGHGFAQRQKVSQEKFIKSFINLSEVNLDRLSNSLLDKFDILLLDMDTWAQIAASERDAILNKVSSSGIGLIIRPSENSYTDKSLQLPTLGSTEEILWETQNSNIPLQIFPIESSPNGWSYLNHQSKKIGIYRSLGLGHILLLTVDDTHQLILANEDDAYQNLWAKVFSLLYKDYNPSSTLIAPKWSWEKEKMHIQLLADQTLSGLPMLDDSISLPYIESPFISNSYELELWANKGRHVISLADTDQKLSFYVHGRDDWKAVRQDYLNMINSTLPWQKDTSENRNSADKKEEIPLQYWYLLTLFGFGALWLDEKLY